jgi:hypothetical protein
VAICSNVKFMVTVSSLVKASQSKIAHVEPKANKDEWAVLGGRSAQRVGPQYTSCLLYQ